MTGSRSDRVLRDWNAVAAEARPPAAAPRTATVRARSGGLGLLPLLAASVAIAVALAWLGGRSDPNGIGGPGSPMFGTASAPTTQAAPTDLPTPTAAGRSCDPGRLAVSITGWDGAAGSRTASLTLRLTGAGGCMIDAVWRPQLIDGNGHIRIDGAPVLDTGTVALRPGETLTTFAQASNDCQPPPAPPVTIAFVLGDGSRVVAAPPSPADLTTPPCNGPGQPGTISMHAWTR